MLGKIDKVYANAPKQRHCHSQEVKYNVSGIPKTFVI